MKLILFAVLLAGCSVTPQQVGYLSPAQCRAYGVEVPDGAQITGEVVHSEFGTLADIERECGGPASGCTKAANVPMIMFPAIDGKYAVYYADHKCVPEHEMCHAWYELRGHTVAFNLRVMQKDRFPACP